MAEAQPSAKRCSVCRDWKPLAAFHACKKTPDGRKAYCKSCHAVKYGPGSAYDAKLKQREKEATRARKDAKRKVCQKCGVAKLRSEFKAFRGNCLSRRCITCMKPKLQRRTIDETRALGRERARRRTPEDRRAARERAAARAGRQFLSRALMTEERAERRRAVLWGVAWRAWCAFLRDDRTEDERRAENRERFRRNYRARQVYEVNRSLTKKRRYRESYRRGGWSESALLAIRDEATHCGYCGRDLESCGRHLDHVHPVCLGGETVTSNLVATCAECNLSKGAMPLLVWLQRQPRHVWMHTMETVAGMSWAA